MTSFDRIKAHFSTFNHYGMEQTDWWGVPVESCHLSVEVAEDLSHNVGAIWIGGRFVMGYDLSATDQLVEYWTVSGFIAATQQYVANL